MYRDADLERVGRILCRGTTDGPQERNGTWHYRFRNGRTRVHRGDTDLAGTERNRTAAGRMEAKARELVLNRPIARAKATDKAVQCGIGRFLAR